jgi:hypothetical protein
MKILKNLHQISSFIYISKNKIEEGEKKKIVKQILIKLKIKLIFCEMKK